MSKGKTNRQSTIKYKTVTCPICDGNGFEYPDGITEVKCKVCRGNKTVQKAILKQYKHPHGTINRR